MTSIHKNLSYIILRCPSCGNTLDTTLSSAEKKSGDILCRVCNEHNPKYEWVTECVRVSDNESETFLKIKVLKDSYEVTADVNRGLTSGMTSVYFFHAFNGIGSPDVWRVLANYYHRLAPHQENNERVFGEGGGRLVLSEEKNGCAMLVATDNRLVGTMHSAVVTFSKELRSASLFEQLLTALVNDNYQ